MMSRINYTQHTPEGQSESAHQWATTQRRHHMVNATVPYDLRILANFHRPTPAVPAPEQPAAAHVPMQQLVDVKVVTEDPVQWSAAPLSVDTTPLGHLEQARQGVEQAFEPTQGDSGELRTTA